MKREEAAKTLVIIITGFRSYIIESMSEIRDLADLKTRLEQASEVESFDGYHRWLVDHGLDKPRTVIKEQKWFAMPEWLTEEVMVAVINHRADVPNFTDETTGDRLSVKRDIKVAINADQYIWLRGLASDRSQGGKERLVIGFGLTVAGANGVSVACVDKVEYGDTTSSSTVNVEHGGEVWEDYNVVVMLGHTHPFSRQSPIAGRFSPRDFENFEDLEIFMIDDKPSACIFAVFTDSWDDVEKNNEPRFGFYYFDPNARTERRLTRLEGLYVVASDLRGVLFHSLNGQRVEVWDEEKNDGSKRQTVGDRDVSYAYPRPVSRPKK